MKTVSVFAVCFLLVVSSAFAQGNGLTIEFDKDTPASEKQAFIDSARKEAAISRDIRAGRIVKTPSRPGSSGQIVKKEKEMKTIGDVIAHRMEESAAIDKKLAEEGNWEALEARRQTREMRRNNNAQQEQLRQIQQTQDDMQRRQRGFGY